jgi:hypothetical protein
MSCAMRFDHVLNCSKSSGGTPMISAIIFTGSG